MRRPFRKVSVGMWAGTCVESLSQAPASHRPWGLGTLLPLLFKVKLLFWQRQRSIVRRRRRCDYGSPVSSIHHCSLLIRGERWGRLSREKEQTVGPRRGGCASQPLGQERVPGGGAVYLWPGCSLSGCPCPCVKGSDAGNSVQQSLAPPL